ncbi:tyrosine-type recombinase/integrase [Candidatus Weimeria sp. HCP3S3_B5]|uniref:tyrosine-type recombinase/integrase n=1 Tax=Candidatus Weimeria sp. HCP3S3_B5 TaxID=3438871 RepID=UPI003F8AF58D
MNDTNLALLEKNRDILSIRDLATGTIATYTSYLTNYINWVEENLPGRSLSDVTWEEIRSYEKYLKDVRKLNPRTINVFISQLRDFYNYVLHKDWDRREVPLLRFDEKLPVVPTQEEVISIINAIDNPKHKAEIALLYSSGICVSELCRLHCGDIHMSTENIYISRSKNRSDRYAMTVSGMEFIRRFLKHVLPSHFNRIRYSVYLTNCRKTFCLNLIHMLRSTVYPGNPYRTMNNPQRNE